ncbi:hypothetical protein J5N97_023040 [Dioscorea zingiberensis]|uniref:Late embryogenesis abundant protein LEA-2 subgroup domain-containing protein n=1 Tax=Dioscorea zingiberensis TaxID=325984 RepID=A0A9D5CC95_9LILI|nr:hypothetical protein J5N97_023040 [Dioscorea zingiberensis]
MADNRQNKPSSYIPPPLPPRLPTYPPSPLRCICITFLILIIIFGITILIIWLIIRPAPIEYTIEDAKVHNFNISSNNALNATFNLTFMSNNRNNKIGLWYDSIDITIWYDNQMVAFGESSPFFQPKKNETTINVDAVAQSTPLMTSVAKNLKKDRSFSEVNLVVKLHARIRFKVGAVKTKHYVMRVECSPVTVNFSSKARFDRKSCDVDI